MESLKGKTILIGKEPGEGRLLVAVAGKFAAIGAPHSVPSCVSRCQVAEGKAHAKLSVDADGKMVITNMKPMNVTFVDGAQVESKHVILSNTIELGAERFSISLPVVLESAKKLVAAASAPTPGPNPKGASAKAAKVFNIRHLERVWDDYQGSIRVLRERQKKINLVRSGCGLFTLCAMPCISFFGTWGFVLTGVGILGNIYSFVGMKNDNTQEEQERLAEEFQDRYVCPNPECNKFLGTTRYKLLVKNFDKCPYCKSEFVEK